MSVMRTKKTADATPIFAMIRLAWIIDFDDILSFRKKWIALYSLLFVERSKVFRGLGEAPIS